ncbi:HflC protein [Escherichia coli]|uniref:HflC protein n=1 Tax=Escherichia coli TaxID=562 RepID=A0A376LG72_ECOLX|nr:HflC protein [Escherichia coli]
MAHQRFQPFTTWQRGGGDISQAEVLLKRKFSDRLRSEIGRLDVKDIVTDSRGPSDPRST